MSESKGKMIAAMRTTTNKSSCIVLEIVVFNFFFDLLFCLGWADGLDQDTRSSSSPSSYAETATKANAFWAKRRRFSLGP